MRIENSINETRGLNSSDHRDSEIKRRRSSGRNGDKIEISVAARKLSSQSIHSLDLKAIRDVRSSRVEEVQRRVASGFYDRSEVRNMMADAVLGSGVVDRVIKEARQVSAIKSQLDEVSEIRTDRVAHAKQRVATSFYDATGVRVQVVDRLLKTMVG